MNKTRRKQQARSKRTRNVIEYIRAWIPAKVTNTDRRVLEKYADAGRRGALAGEALRERLRPSGNLTREKLEKAAALMRKQLGPPPVAEGKVFVERDGLFVPLGAIRDFKKPEFMKADAEVFVMREPAPVWYAI